MLSQSSRLSVTRYNTITEFNVNRKAECIVSYIHLADVRIVVNKLICFNRRCHGRNDTRERSCMQWRGLALLSRSSFVSLCSCGSLDIYVLLEVLSLAVRVCRTQNDRLGSAPAMWVVINPVVRLRNPIWSPVEKHVRQK